MCILLNLSDNLVDTSSYCNNYGEATKSTIQVATVIIMVKKLRVLFFLFVALYFGRL